MTFFASQETMNRLNCEKKQTILKRLKRKLIRFLCFLIKEPYVDVIHGTKHY